MLADRRMLPRHLFAPGLEYMRTRPNVFYGPVVLPHCSNATQVVLVPPRVV